MKSPYSVIILFVLFILFFAYEKLNYEPPKSPITQPFQSIGEIETFILGQKIETLKNSSLSEYYTLKDTILGDEGVEWDGLMFSSLQNQEEIFLAESNWVDRGVISRITILSDQIKVGKDISIQSKYTDIKGRIDQSRKNDFPDGYLILYDAEHKGLAYIMDISEHPELIYGISSFDSIPLSLRIKSMVINDLR